MSPVVLQRIRELVAQGGIVAGPKPQQTPGLEDYPHASAELKALTDEMWGSVDGVKLKEKALGNGRIYSVDSLGELFASEHVPADFSYHSAAAGTQLGYVHRSTDDTEVYFVSNRKDRSEVAECIFRVPNKQPRILDPVTGNTWPAVSFKQSSGLTTVPLEFAPYGSLFVTFQGPTSGEDHGIGNSNFPVYSEAGEITGPWNVSFDPNWGGPSNAEFEKLISWTKRPEDGIKYYSGAATYHKSFDLPPALQGGHARLALDLGAVKYVAQVRLNGKDLGAVWTKPFRVDITDAVKPTGNVLEIDVANLWPNRIIGDSVLPPERRLTHTNIVYTQDTPLWESGLLGPVTIESIQEYGK
jgi:hypothetical protein